MTTPNTNLANSGETVPAIKSGRAFNGAHRDAGTIVHAVPPMPKTASGFWGDKALCGTQPGYSGNGWTDTNRQINCPKCLKKLTPFPTNQ